MKPSVAIVMRTKDRPVFLRRALKSVASQTFTDWTLAIVNDHGDGAAVDNAVAELPIEVANKIQRVEAPRGLLREGLINVGIEATSSEYIAILDDDDTWQPEFLSTTLGFFDKSVGAKYVGVVTGSQIVFERFEKDCLKEVSTTNITGWLRDLTLWQMLGQNLFPIHALLYRRSALETAGPYKNLSVLGDWEFNIRLLIAGDLAGLPEYVGANYHQRVASDKDSAKNTVLDATEEHEAQRHAMIGSSHWAPYMKLAAALRGLELDVAKIEDSLVRPSRLASKFTRSKGGSGGVDALEQDREALGQPRPLSPEALNEALREDMRAGIIGEGVAKNIVAASLRLEGHLKDVATMIAPISRIASLPFRVKSAFR